LKCTVGPLQKRAMRGRRLAFDRVDEVAGCCGGSGTAIGQDRSQVVKIDGALARRIVGPKDSVGLVSVVIGSVPPNID
jgi:hypothetical protein